ncbi:hypothetical protein [Helicobacter pylori]|uniref:hypothetical protein n=1 Tax=Helicobacter pylori TaxID=210 RepID=UPI0005359273|nr:hypothetical protein [Helicobacter pylori]
MKKPKKPSSYQRLKTRNQELELENSMLKDKMEKLELKHENEIRDLRSQVSRLNHNFERMCDLLLAKNPDSNTQKYIYCKGDGNSVGQLISLSPKEEGVYSHF